MERDMDHDIERYDRRRRIEKIDRLADWLDARYRIPGTRIRFGGDALIGLIPGVGDTLTLLLSAYVMSLAKDLKLPMRTRAKMAMNAGIDWAVGLVPFVGDLLDIGYKGNLKNLQLIRRHYREQYGEDEGGPEIIEIQPRKVS